MNCSTFHRLLPPLLSSMALASFALQAAGAEPMGCLITPSNTVELGSPAIGIIDKVQVERGDEVKATQVLATLRADVERAHVSLAALRAAADAELQAATKTHALAVRKRERAQDLYEKQFVSAQAVDIALAEEHAAESRRDQAREQSMQARTELLVANVELATRTIRSPINGVVVDVFRHGGERVEEKPIMKIAALDPLHAEVVLPASMYGRLKAGDAVMIQPALKGLPSVAGTVHVVDALVDPSSNTFRARIVVPNPQRTVPPGLRCKLLLPGEDQKAANASASATTGTGVSSVVSMAR